MPTVPLKRSVLLILIPLAGFAAGEAVPAPVRLLGPEQTVTELRTHLLPRVPAFEMPASADAWTAEAERLRERVLEEIVYRGVPRSWRSEPTEVVWGDTIPEKGYAIRKFRYAVVPGLWVGGLLYEPDELKGKVPAVMNVNGHVGAPGMSIDYKQVRCINLAKRGMLTLNLEWIGMGQLGGAGYSHQDAVHLELCGIAGVSIHYLSLKRGLDILLAHPAADAERVAVTGLSGGGWQTIFISALDTRVRLSAPNAGYVGFASRVLSQPDMGDDEQSPTDLGTVADYVHLTAMLAPRPALLIYNARDECCFRSDRARPSLYEPVKPLYELFSAPDSFEFHENHDPGTHNYDLDNRQAFYRFLNRHFLPQEQWRDEEIPVDDEVRTQEELSIVYPENNGSFYTLAGAAMASLPAEPLRAGASEGDRRRLRERLRGVLRLGAQPPSAEQAQGSATGPHAVRAEPVEGSALPAGASRAWLLGIGGKWTLPAVEYGAGGAGAPRTTLILADGWRESAAPLVSRVLAEGDRAVVVDILFTGESLSPLTGQPAWLWSLLIGTLGERSLGIQASQVEAVLHWIRQGQEGRPVRVMTQGRAAGLAALVQAALEPDSLTSLDMHQMDGSLKELLVQRVHQFHTPSVYCPGLLEAADVPDLIELARPVRIRLHTD